MKEGVKKSISLILVLTLLVQLLPVVAFGVGDETNDLDSTTRRRTGPGRRSTTRCRKPVSSMLPRRET